MNVKILVAWLAVDIFWGATFLSMRVVLESIPPFVLVFIRFTIAGLLMLAWAGFKEGNWRIELIELRGVLITGFGMFTLGNGFNTIGLQYVPSSIATLISAAGAIWMVLLDWAFRGNRPGFAVAVGLTISMAGVFVLVGKPETGGLSIMWLSCCLLASLIWCISAYGARLMRMPKTMWQTFGWQNLCGGLCGGLVMICTGEWGTLSFVNLPHSAWIGFAYLVICGSMLGFTSYQWLLVNASPLMAGSTSLVNPIVAMLLGALILNELFTLRIFIAFLLVTAGVITIIIAQHRQKI